MPPQVGAGGGTPRPRNDSADSIRMTTPTRVVNSTMIGGSTLGRMWRHRMRGVEAPIDCAACTYMFSRTETTAERMMREPAMPSSRPSVTMICGMPGPTTDTDHDQDDEVGEALPGVDEALGDKVDLAAEVAGDDAERRRR